MAEKELVLEKHGKVSIVRREGGSLMIRYYAPRESGRGSFVRKSARTDDISLARVFAHAIDRELREAGGLPVRPERQAPVDLFEAFGCHPATLRERDQNEPDYRRHVAYLTEFTEWVSPGGHRGCKFLKDLKIEAVLAYVAHLVADGFAWDSRRHRLIALRRAAAMGPQFGLIDVLNRIKLDRHSGDEDEEVHCLDQQGLARLLLKVEGDPRALAAIGVQALMGFRPSEVLRLQVGDIKLAEGTLCIGRRKRKNSQSRRELPIPGILLEWLKPLCADQSEGAPLIRSEHRGFVGQAFNHSAFSHWLSPMLGSVSEKCFSVKSLRKTFATVAICEWNIEERHVESFLGHMHSAVASVTNRHYLQKARVRELRPVAEKIDKDFRAALMVAREQQQESEEKAAREALEIRNYPKAIQKTEKQRTKKSRSSLITSNLRARSSVG